MSCVWTPDPDVLAAVPTWAPLTQAEKDRALMLATSSLQMLTYYRVGTCPVTIRPCPKPKPCPCWGSLTNGVTPFFYETAWLAGSPWYVCGTCKSPCEPTNYIDIPGPVGFIDKVKINGTVVDVTTADWRMDDGHVLVWQGTGPSPFPETQNLDLPDTAVGTYSITYSRSAPVNPDAKIAVAHLALEYAKAAGPKGKCSLPKGVTNVVRNGVSFSVEAGLFPGGLTGIEIVDAFILKWAPAGSPVRTATVFNPRGAAARRTGAVPKRTTGMV